MKIYSFAAAILFTAAVFSTAHCAQDDSSAGSGSATSNVVTGGLVGGGVGAEVKGYSKDRSCDDSFRRAGVVAVDGRLSKVDRDRVEKMQAQEQMKARVKDYVSDQEVQAYQRAPKRVPINSEVKQKVRRQYDDEGNLISAEDAERDKSDTPLDWK